MEKNEKLIQFEKFYIDNPYDFSEEEFEKIREDIESPRKGVVYDEYVDFNLWTKGLKSRHNYFVDYVENKFPLHNYKKILEVGCGRTARVSRILSEKGYIMTAMDSKISIDKVMSNFIFVRAKFDVNKTDISKFDAIIAQEPCEATEHIVRACVAEKKDFIISLCGTPHRLISGEEPTSLNEWYDYLERIGGDNCFIINSKIVPGYFCPVMRGIFGKVI